MPLKSGPVGGAAFKNNIKEMVEAGHPQKQAVAAAYREAGEGRHDARIRAYTDSVRRGDAGAVTNFHRDDKR